MMWLLIHTLTTIKPFKVSLHYRELLRFSGQSTWCYYSYLWHSFYLGPRKKGPKTCVHSEWPTTLCALRIALTKWDGPVMCKHVVWRHRKCWNFFKQILSYSGNKNLFDSIREGAWKYQVTLSLFSVDFMQIMMIISPSSCGTRANVRDLFIATAAKRIPRRAWFAAAISKLEFSNTNLKIFYEMKYERATI